MTPFGFVCKLSEHPFVTRVSIPNQGPCCMFSHVLFSLLSRHSSLCYLIKVKWPIKNEFQKACQLLWCELYEDSYIEAFLCLHYLSVWDGQLNNVAVWNDGKMYHCKMVYFVICFILFIQHISSHANSMCSTQKVKTFIGHGVFSGI